ncbi:MAG: hypothetical protein SNJ61_08775 [Fimbriimonadaceae bacterium]
MSNPPSGMRERLVRFGRCLLAGFVSLSILNRLEFPEERSQLAWFLCVAVLAGSTLLLSIVLDCFPSAAQPREFSRVHAVTFPVCFVVCVALIVRLTTTTPVAIQAVPEVLLPVRSLAEPGNLAWIAGSQAVVFGLVASLKARRRRNRARTA